MPAVFCSGSLGIVSAATPEVVIVIPGSCEVVRVTLSLGSSRARAKTSKPGPKFAEVAGAFRVNLFGSDAPRFLPVIEMMWPLPIKVIFNQSNRM